MAVKEEGPRQGRSPETWLGNWNLMSQALRAIMGHWVEK